MKKILILTLIGFTGLSQAQVVYKFKDANGKIIYSDSIPTNEKSEYSILSGKSGVLKKVVDKELTQEEAEKLAQEKELAQKNKQQLEEQRKKDNSLLATYSSVNEITKLKNFELNQINQSIKNQITNITDLKDKINQANEILTSNPNNKKIKENIQDLQSKLTSANSILDENKKLLEERTQKYQSDEVRYVELLKEMSTKK